MAGTLRKRSTNHCQVAQDPKETSIPPTAISVHPNHPADEQNAPLHNPWHPDIPAVAEVEPGEAFRVECMKWTAGQILNNDTADDVRDLDLARTHYLSGPIAVGGAEPGDLLAVEGWGSECATVPSGVSPPSWMERTASSSIGSASRKAIWDIDGLRDLAPHRGSAHHRARSRRDHGLCPLAPAPPPVERARGSRRSCGGCAEAGAELRDRAGEHAILIS